MDVAVLRNLPLLFRGVRMVEPLEPAGMVHRVVVGVVGPLLGRRIGKKIAEQMGATLG
jgi:uncharacterized membrane protein YeaQ/YmgE (transglycosylase-associated protein family)